MSQPPGFDQQHPQGQPVYGQPVHDKLPGIFILGFIFGPLAILNAGRAEAHGVPATFGKVAGWIVTVLSFIWLLFIIVMVVVALATGAITPNS